VAAIEFITIDVKLPINYLFIRTTEEVEGTVQSAGLKERRLINYKGSAKRGTAGVNNLVNNFPVGQSSKGIGRG
jgi:hypothetical protein